MPYRWKAWACAFVISWCHPAMAGGLFYSNLYVQETSVNSNGFFSQSTDWNADLRVLYASVQGWMAGPTYSLVLGNGNNGYLQNQGAVGATLGYYFGHWVGTFTYYPWVDRIEQSGGNTTHYRQGQGWGMDLAYLLEIAGSVQLGPTLSYHRFFLQERQVNDLERIPWSYSREDVSPTIGLLMLF